MGFFTDSEKGEENINFKHDFFPNFHFNSEEHQDSVPQNQNNSFFSKQGISTSKICRTDPEDQNYMICKIKEKKLVNENGKDKYVTNEREEREPISNNPFNFSNFFWNNNKNLSDQSWDFNHFRNFRNEEKNHEEDPFLDGRNQNFLDFIPRIKSYFFGRKNENEVSFEKNQKNKNDFFNEEDFHNFFSPPLILRNFFFNDPFMNDPFFRNSPSFFNMNNHDGFHNNNINFGQQTNTQNQQNFQNNRNKSTSRQGYNYSYPNYGGEGHHNKGGDIYDF